MEAHARLDRETHCGGCPMKPTNRARQQGRAVAELFREAIIAQQFQEWSKPVTPDEFIPKSKNDPPCASGKRRKHEPVRREHFGFNREIES